MTMFPTVPSDDQSRYLAMLCFPRLHDFYTCYLASTKGLRVQGLGHLLTRERHESGIATSTDHICASEPLGLPGASFTSAADCHRYAVV